MLQKLVHMLSDMSEGRSGGQVSMLAVAMQYGQSMSILTVIISEVLLIQSQFTM